MKVHRLYIDCNRVIINVKGTNFDFSLFSCPRHELFSRDDPFLNGGESSLTWIKRVFRYDRARAVARISINASNASRINFSVS